MAKGIIILGNGFDLDLGLETSYSSFAKSEQWKDLMDNNEHSKDINWLLGFIKSKYEVEKWIDIEAALLEYAMNKTSNSIMAYSKGDEIDFIALCKSLKAYLTEQQSLFKPTKKSVASLLLTCLGKITNYSKLYTFNYTQLDVLAAKCNYDPLIDAEHIHGSLADDGELIFGIETRANTIDERYAFLFKTQNRKYHHTDLLKDLRDKDEYIFFGHSLNGMDYNYFNSLFISLAGSVSKTPRLTIITKNEYDEYSFKNYLRRNISLQGLFSNSLPTFILTDEVYRGNENEQRKVMELLSRVQAM
jgi:hypothetical protein